MTEYLTFISHSISSVDTPQIYFNDGSQIIQRNYNEICHFNMMKRGDVPKV